TNRDLEKHAARGLFRQDLYYRLAGTTLEVPPLRRRPGDIGPLVHTFLLHASRNAARSTGAPATISPEAMAMLRAYRWPGNIRELRNVIESAVLLAGNTIITPAHLPLERMQAASRAPTSSEEPTEPAGFVDESRQSVIEVLTACGGN